MNKNDKIISLLQDIKSELKKPLKKEKKKPIRISKKHKIQRKYNRHIPKEINALDIAKDKLSLNPRQIPFTNYRSTFPTKINPFYPTEPTYFQTNPSNYIQSLIPTAKPTDTSNQVVSIITQLLSNNGVIPPPVAQPNQPLPPPEPKQPNQPLPPPEPKQPNQPPPPPQPKQPKTPPPPPPVPNKPQEKEEEEEPGKVTNKKLEEAREKIKQKNEAMRLKREQEAKQNFVEKYQNEYPNLTIDNIEAVLGSKADIQNKINATQEIIRNIQEDLAANIDQDNDIISSFYHPNPITHAAAILKYPLEPQQLTLNILKQVIKQPNQPKFQKWFNELEKENNDLAKLYQEKAVINEATSIGFHSGAGKNRFLAKHGRKNLGNGLNYTASGYITPEDEDFLMHIEDTLLNKVGLSEEDTISVIEYIVNGYNIRILGDVVYVIQR